MPITEFDDAAVRVSHAAVVSDRVGLVPRRPAQRTSLLGAVFTACGLGYGPVVICGGPLDNTPHYFEPDWIRSNFEKEVPDTVDGNLAIWNHARKAFAGRVFSMSGRTREFLGAPERWMNGNFDYR